MTFDEIYERLPGNGWLSKDEAGLLWAYVNAADGPILEVGCHQGRSSVLLAHAGRPVYSVDPFDGFESNRSGDDVERLWRANLAPYQNVTLFRQRLEAWDSRPCGFVYCDGDHTYMGTVNQILMALKCGAKVIAVHDVNDSGGGLEIKQACIELLGEWTERAERLAVWVR